MATNELGKDKTMTQLDKTTQNAIWNNYRRNTLASLALPMIVARRLENQVTDSTTREEERELYKEAATYSGQANQIIEMAQDAYNAIYPERKGNRFEQELVALARKAVTEALFNEINVEQACQKIIENELT